MKFLRYVLPALVILGCVVAWVWLRQLQDQSRDEPYSLIEERLYAGKAVVEPPPGTSAVVNLCDVKDRYEVDAVLWEPIRDAPPAPDLDWLRRQVDFIETRLDRGDTVYVHCAAGSSRSGLVVTAYLMREHGWGRDRALAFARSRRPQFNPNDAFMDLLADWERFLHNKKGEHP